MLHAAGREEVYLTCLAQLLSPRAALYSGSPRAAILLMPRGRRQRIHSTAARRSGRATTLATTRATTRATTSSVTAPTSVATTGNAAPPPYAEEGPLDPSLGRLLQQIRDEVRAEMEEASQDPAPVSTSAAQPPFQPLPGAQHGMCI